MQPTVSKVRFNSVGDELLIELIESLGCNSSEPHRRTGFSFPRGPKKSMHPRPTDKKSPSVPFKVQPWIFYIFVSWYCCNLLKTRAFLCHWTQSKIAGIKFILVTFQALFPNKKCFLKYFLRKTKSPTGNSREIHIRVSKSKSEAICFVQASMAKAYQKPLKLSHLGFLNVTAKAQLEIQMQSKYLNYLFLCPPTQSLQPQACTPLLATVSCIQSCMFSADLISFMRSNHGYKDYSCERYKTEALAKDIKAYGNQWFQQVRDYFSSTVQTPWF